jgi:hypothetical protein
LKEYPKIQDRHFLGFESLQVPQGKEHALLQVSAEFKKKKSLQTEHPFSVQVLQFDGQDVH